MKTIFALFLAFTSTLYAYAQENEQKPSQLTYSIKVLCMAEIISDENITDSSEIYCLLNDKLSKLDFYPLESAKIFHNRNYKFFRVRWTMRFYDSCKDGSDSLVANVFTSKNPYGGAATFTVAIKTEKVVQKDGSVRNLHRVYKIEGFTNDDIKQILYEIYQNKAEKPKNIKKLVNKNDIYIEGVEILDMIEPCQN